MIGIVTKLATHDFLESRWKYAHLNLWHKKWNKYIELSKNDRMYKDYIDTDNDLVYNSIIENILRCFCEISEKEFFGVTLYTCYLNISPDVDL